MKYFFTSGAMLVFFILLNTGLMAQSRKTDVQIMWKVAATIPPPPDGSQQFGLAGAWTGINNEMLLIAGGANFPEGMPWLGGKKKYYNDVYAFRKKQDGTLRSIKKTFQLPFNIAYGASCSTPQGIVCVGGENEAGPSNKVILLQWDKVAEKIVIKDLPSLPFAVSNAAITCNGAMVYIAGGEIKDGGVTAAFRRFDLDNIAIGWKELPSFPKPVSHGVLVAQSAGKELFIFLMGGRMRTPSGISELYASVYAYDVKKEKWQEKKSLPYALSAGTGAGYGNNKILLFGGDKGETFRKTELLIAAINAENDAAKKAALTTEKISLQSVHPGFSKQVLQYNTITNEWHVAGTIPFDVPVTTNVVTCGYEVFIPSGEIKAGVRTPLVLVGKIKSVK